MPLSRREVLASTAGTMALSSIAVGAASARSDDAPAEHASARSDHPGDTVRSVRQRREAIRNNAGELLDTLEAEGYLPSASVEQFDLDNEIDADESINAASDNRGYRVVRIESDDDVPIDNETILVVSHTGEGGRLSIFVQLSSGAANAALETDDGTELVHSDGTVTSSCSGSVFETCSTGNCACWSNGPYCRDDGQVVRMCCSWFGCSIIDVQGCGSCVVTGHCNC